MQCLRFVPAKAFWAAIALAAALTSVPSTRSAVPADLDKHLNLTPENAPKSYRVVQIDGNQTANVLYPGERFTLGLQVVNLTAAAINTGAKAELYRYQTEADEFRAVSVKEELLATMPLPLAVPAKGFVNLTIQPPVPQRFGAYVVVVDVPGHGRQLAAGLLRVPQATPGKVQHPTFAMDIRGFEPVKAMMWKRLGIKGTRLEVGVCPTKDKNFAHWLENTVRGIRVLGDHDITCMLTMGGGGNYDLMPLGHIRSFLNDKAEGPMTYPGDFAWEPKWDGQFRQALAALLAELGWPKGPVNAVELWNEPWEGISISGWGADCLRYREIYTAMAQAVEDARARHNVQVLIGGGCSSMNTEDKLFCDGKDTFLPWLDFTSIHYQPLERPAFAGPRVGQPQKPLRPGAGLEHRDLDRQLRGPRPPVIASMRAQGQSRTAGVLHDVCSDLQNVDLLLEGGKTRRIDVVQVLGPGGGHRLHPAFHRPAEVPRAALPERPALGFRLRRTSPRQSPQPGRRHAGRRGRPRRRLPPRDAQVPQRAGLGRRPRRRAASRAGGAGCRPMLRRRSGKGWRNSSTRPRCSRTAAWRWPTAKVCSASMTSSAIPSSRKAANWWSRWTAWATSSAPTARPARSAS